MVFAPRLETFFWRIASQRNVSSTRELNELKIGTKSLTSVGEVAIVFYLRSRLGLLESLILYFDELDHFGCVS